MSREQGQKAGRIHYFTRQVLEGFQALESHALGPSAMGEKVTHADVMTVVAYQAASLHPIYT
jgi:hypothetical protein